VGKDLEDSSSTFHEKINGRNRVYFLHFFIMPAGPIRPSFLSTAKVHQGGLDIRVKKRNGSDGLPKKDHYNDLQGG